MAVISFPIKQIVVACILQKLTQASPAQTELKVTCIWMQSQQCAYMYSRCAEWTAAALLYRHSTMTEDNTSSVASNCGAEQREITWKSILPFVLAAVYCAQGRLRGRTYSESES